MAEQVVEISANKSKRVNTCCPDCRSTCPTVSIFYLVRPDSSSRILPTQWPVPHGPQASPAPAPQWPYVWMGLHLSIPVVRYFEGHLWTKAHTMHLLRVEGWGRKVGTNWRDNVPGRTCMGGTSVVAFDLWPHFRHAPQNFPQVFSLCPHPAVILLWVPRQPLPANISPKEQIWVRNTGLPWIEVRLLGISFSVLWTLAFVGTQDSTTRWLDPFILWLGLYPLGCFQLLEKKNQTGWNKRENSKEKHHGPQAWFCLCLSAHSDLSVRVLPSSVGFSLRWTPFTVVRWWAANKIRKRLYVLVFLSSEKKKSVPAALQLAHTSVSSSEMDHVFTSVQWPMKRLRHPCWLFQPRFPTPLPAIRNVCY